MKGLYTKIRNVQPHYHKQLLYLQTKISDDDLVYLKEEAKNILENESQFKKYNKTLAGNIEKEYKLEKTQQILNPYLFDLANKYIEYFEHKQKYQDWWDTTDMWINFQKKYEHNPLHNHGGKFSFVLWVQIPYELKEELVIPNCQYSNTPTNSLFSFVYTNVFGEVINNIISVDKYYEGTIIMFNSNLKHLVYPFHTSNDYRISISGNLK
jgi:hypothetical protein